MPCSFEVTNDNASLPRESLVWSKEILYKRTISRVLMFAKFSKKLSSRVPNFANMIIFLSSLSYNIYFVCFLFLGKMRFAKNVKLKATRSKKLIQLVLGLLVTLFSLIHESDPDVMSVSRRQWLRWHCVRNVFLLVSC